MKISARSTNVIEFFSFMGFFIYYHWFIMGFVAIALHMTHPTQKEVLFEWDDKYEMRF